LPLIENKCKGCTECCKELAFQFDGMVDSTFREFYKVRGCMLRYLKDSTFLTIPTPCQHLRDYGCKIYDERPENCRQFDGRTHPLLKGICKLEAD